MPDDSWSDLITDPSEFSEEIELHDDEFPRCKEIIEDIGRKYSHREASPGNLRSMAAECIDKLREVGLVAQIWPGKRVMKMVGIPFDDPSGTLEEDFTFRIVGRLNESPYELERHQHQVKGGEQDAYWEDRMRREAEAAAANPKPPPVIEEKQREGLIVPGDEE